MSRMRYQLGSHNDRKVYYLYPHFSSYFSHLFSQFQQVDWSQHQHLHNIAQVINNIIHDIQSAKILYFQQFLLVLQKLSQLQPHNFPMFLHLIPSLNHQSIQNIKSTRVVDVSSTMYSLFGGLSLGKYLEGLTVDNIYIGAQIETRMIDGNVDKLSRLNIPTLGELILQSNEITGEGIKMIVKHSDWKLLKRLNLSRNLINNQSLRVLCKSNWRYLKELGLQGNPFGDKGVDFICKYGNFPFLQTLDLRSKQAEQTTLFPTLKDQYWHCQLTNKSVYSILQKDWKNLTNLKIRIYKTEVTCDRSSQIKQKLIQCLFNQ